MIRCNPQGMFSGNYDLRGEGHSGTLTFNWLSEQGMLVADRSRHRIRKEGMLSGRWVLLKGSRKVATAQKSNPFSRTFEINDDDGALTLRASNMIGRTFRLERGVSLVARISPLHPLTRKSQIVTTRRHVDFTTLAFAFWLVALTRRRSSQSAAH